jgi:pimeloyl-ACP methyl ester carboxylesterase
MKTGAPAARLRRRAGPADGPRVRLLLLSGLAGSPAVWNRWAALAGDTVEIWDAVLPWTGGSDVTWSRSGAPGDWVEQAMADVPGGADVVVAHSFAAMILLEVLASSQGRLPRAAVVVAPFHRSVPEDFDWTGISYYLNGFHRILEEGLRVGSNGRLPPDLLAPIAERVRERVGPYGWMRFFEAYLRSPFLDAAALRLPVLVVGGEGDLAARPDDARTLAKALPDARLEILGGCGHFPMAEEPARFAAVLHDFVAPLCPDPTTQRS